jgi:hypothetical protein
VSHVVVGQRSTEASGQDIKAPFCNISHKPSTSRPVGGRHSAAQLLARLSRLFLGMQVALLFAGQERKEWTTSLRSSLQGKRRTPLQGSVGTYEDD